MLKLLTNSYQASVKGPASAITLTYDANGNMTSDGTNSYSYDAENRLIKIAYPGTGNNSQFAYDGNGRNVTILEYTSASLTSTKQFVWCASGRCETRNASSGITAQYFANGQTTNGTDYFYTADRLGSIRDMTNVSAVVQDQLAYNPFGRVIELQGTQLPDMQFGGYYTHTRSGLNLTLTRAYSSNFARWLNRDQAQETAGANLYAFVVNSPIALNDPFGLTPCCTDALHNQLTDLLHSDFLQALSQYNSGKRPPFSLGAPSAAVGNIIDYLFKTLVNNDSSLQNQVSTTPRGSAGPDVVGPCGWWWDVTSANAAEIVDHNVRFAAQGYNPWNGYFFLYQGTTRFVIF